MDAHGHPAVRTVLLKDLDERGIVFYTNYSRTRAASSRPTRTRRPSSLGAAGAPGAHLPGRSTRSTGPRPRPTSPAGHAARRSGAWASPQSSVVAVAGGPGGCGPRPRASASTDRTSPPRRTGAGYRIGPSWSSSGRAGPTGCTTGCGTASLMRPGGRTASSVIGCPRRLGEPAAGDPAVLSTTASSRRPLPGGCQRRTRRRRGVGAGAHAGRAARPARRRHPPAGDRAVPAAADRPGHRRSSARCSPRSPCRCRSTP